ncbi:hypothetical protein F5Y15DRAFT_409325 [Xylariaceae sp. FL0016]|nr:hypothetical protein F5Y15DRAFT_409325 [Xylariaceae sp. FL0016]
MDVDDPKALEGGMSRHMSTFSTATTLKATDTFPNTRAPLVASNPNKKGEALIPVSTKAPVVGDAYYVGSIYQHQHATASDEKDGPYLRYIKLLSKRWPRLKYLADFVDAGTAPKKAVNLVHSDVFERQRRVKVAVVDFSQPQAIAHRVCVNGAELQEELGVAQTARAPEELRCNRLFIVEDLSSTTIELLGSMLDIDPAFFRGHLEDHTWFNIKDEWVEMPELQSQAAGKLFTSLRYMEPRFFEDSDESQRAIDQTGEWNVIRRIDFEGQVKSGANAWWEDSPHQVGLLRRKVSIWSKKDENGWKGVILVDPSLADGLPLWNGYGRLDSPPSMSHIDEATHPETSPALLHMLVSRVQSLSKEEHGKLQEDPEYVVSQIYPLVLGEILVTLQYTFTGLFQIEWHLDSERHRKAEDIEVSLNMLHKWQRRLPFYVSWIQDAIMALEARYSLNPMAMTASPAQNTHNTASLTNTWQEDLRGDLMGLLGRLRTLQGRADKIMEMAVSILSVEESKKAIEESRNVSRVSYLAFVFVPMTFVTGFLSMNDEVHSRNPIVYCVLFGVGVPLSVFAFILAVYWVKIMDWIRTPGNPGVMTSNGSEIHRKKKGKGY